MRSLLFVFALLTAIAMAEKYAMIFGTAEGWSNYSITSDPCRVYTDLIRAGMKPENIIYMSYTSAVTFRWNPLKGMLFTDPAETTDGDWVKYGCIDQVDYKGRHVNPDVFLAILRGDDEVVTEMTGIKNPKVLHATPDDTVFTYFIDHGSDGLICVGDDIIKSDEFIETLKRANRSHLYGKWVWFMEACHSGSMFEGILPEDLNIFVMTSSDSHHNAKMSNCPPNDVVGGVALETCLSGLWDNAYLDYLEQHPKTTIGEIVDAVTAEISKTSDQGVSQWGDKSFRDLPLSDFFGELPSPSFRRPVVEKSDSSVLLSEVPAHLAKWRAIRADKSEVAEALAEYQRIAFENAKKEVEVMRLGSALLNEKAANKALNTPAESYAVSCVRDLTISLHEKCGHSLPLSEKSTNLLRNICLPGLTMPNMNWNEICF